MAGLGGMDEGAATPQLVAAWFVLDRVQTDRLPWWAAQWLADGEDGEFLRELAGLNERDSYDVRQLLPGALHEMAVPLPASVEEAVGVVFTDLAQRCVDGQVGERQVVRVVEDIVQMVDYAAEVLDLPLGGIYGFDDAWAGGWGPSVSELKDQVRSACAEQLQRGA